MQPWLRVTGIEKEERIHTGDFGSLCILLDQGVRILDSGGRRKSCFIKEHTLKASGWWEQGRSCAYSSSCDSRQSEERTQSAHDRLRAGLTSDKEWIYYLRMNNAKK